MCQSAVFIRAQVAPRSQNKLKAVRGLCNRLTRRKTTDWPSERSTGRRSEASLCHLQDKLRTGNVSWRRPKRLGKMRVFSVTALSSSSFCLSATPALNDACWTPSSQAHKWMILPSPEMLCSCSQWTEEDWLVLVKKTWLQQRWRRGTNQLRMSYHNSNNCKMFPLGITSLRWEQMNRHLHPRTRFHLRTPIVNLKGHLPPSRSC
jgi:hypothetical protein